MPFTNDKSEMRAEWRREMLKHQRRHIGFWFFQLLKTATYIALGVIVGQWLKS